MVGDVLKPHTYNLNTNDIHKTKTKQNNYLLLLYNGFMSCKQMTN